MAAPQYRPLDTSKDEIRLLFVFHNENSKTFRCTLKYFPLSSAPPYVALSYAWREPSAKDGEAPRRDAVVVDDRDALLTTNLALALRTLRVETECLWVDALCID